MYAWHDEELAASVGESSLEQLLQHTFVFLFAFETLQRLPAGLLNMDLGLFVS